MSATQSRPTAPLGGIGPEKVPLLDEPILVARGVTKWWNPRQPPILDGVDLEISPGSIIALQGRNGAGKTTLLRILAGLFLPASGTVTLDGLNPIRHRRAYQSRIGYMPAAQGGLYARLSVKRHLEYWARLALLPAVERRQAVITALARFSLDELASSRVDRLSMGQRQRVRLALAFLHNPDVVLLDEPRNSLDSDGIALLISVLAEFRQRGRSVIWCAPSIEEADLELDAVHELISGKLVQL
jgi:ABC-type multidrug transport system ATPase subunit